MSVANPCVSCGACCATFRVSFYWAEADDAPGGVVPAGLTTPLGGLYRAMRGTEQKPPRCYALQGEIGERVHCSVYSLRPSTCREFQVSGEQGVSNPHCDRARRQWGLPPLDIPPGRPPLVLPPDLPIEEPPRAA